MLAGTIVILALLLFVYWAGKGVMVHPLRDSTVELLIDIEGALDDYKLGHGTFPINPAENRQEAALEGAIVLYQHLSGDFDFDGELDPGERSHLTTLLDPTSKCVAILEDGRRAVADPNGNLVRYLCDPPNRLIDGKVKIRTYNPTYDMWSIGKAMSGESSVTAREKWITNWGILELEEVERER